MKRSAPDVVLFVALGVLCLNLVSQFAAFPFQIALTFWALSKKDVRYLPGLFILQLDQLNFAKCGAHSYVKISIAGIGVSLLTGFMIITFLLVCTWFMQGRYDRKTSILILFWIIGAIPAIEVALTARRDGVSFWQSPFSDFLAPALYFWAIQTGKSWETGKDYFCKRMTAILLVCDALWVLREMKLFGFYIHISSICLMLVAFRRHFGFGMKILSSIGAAVGFVNILFLRYMQMESETGYSSSSDVGSSFTTLLTVVICIGMALSFVCKSMLSKLKMVPYVALVIAVSVVLYASGRYRSEEASAVFQDYQTFLERFEYKLIADRGSIWSESIDAALSPPYLFARLKDRLRYDLVDKETGNRVTGMMCLPHNQVLTLLVMNGWWLGGILIVFLWIVHIRSFGAAFRLHDDVTVLSFLLPASAAIFIAVGLTGQSVLTGSITGNGMVTLVFPGLMYGAAVNHGRRMKCVFYG